MGALHGGHLSLVQKARTKVTKVVASIFVNPTQFAPGEDFDTYPRDESADRAKLDSAGCDLVYLPTVEEMYPEGTRTNVRVEQMSDLLDGIYRPHFFYGVATVVARLFLHVQPDVAVFGEKDYQQLQIIRRMVKDLGFPIEILGGETTRDGDGLAQSSRNLYLSPEQRRAAGPPVAGRDAVRRAGRSPAPDHGVRIHGDELCQPRRPSLPGRPARRAPVIWHGCAAARRGMARKDAPDRQYQRDAVNSFSASRTA